MQILKVLGLVIWFAASLTLVVIGQLKDGPVWLGVMLLGLASLLAMLWLYNRKYTRADRLVKRQQKERERELSGK